MVCGGGSWSGVEGFSRWRSQLVRELEERISVILFSDADDCWIWRPSVEEGFSVKSLIWCTSDFAAAWC
jgi:hypothetical protein